MNNFNFTIIENTVKEIKDNSIILDNGVTGILSDKLFETAKQNISLGSKVLISGNLDLNKHNTVNVKEINYMKK